MNHTSFLVEALNDLIQINEERVNGYLQAAKEMGKKDSFLKEICMQIVLEGKKNIQSLLYQIKKINSELPQTCNQSSKAITFWNETTEVNVNDDFKTSFASCVCSEDAVQKMYEDTLLTYTFMPIELRTIMTQQKKKIGYLKKGIMTYLNINRIVAVA